MSISEIRVPDLGDFKQVIVAEVLIAPGDHVDIEQPLLMVESDKAAMDIPSPASGVIVEVLVKATDSVSTDALIATIELSDASRAPAAAPLLVEPKAALDFDFDTVVIGGGPGGYSAAFRAADLGQSVAIIERDAVLGGVCLNVGCIPSKALLHVAAIKEEAERLADHGVSFGAPQVDLGKLRDFKSATIKRLTDGLGQMSALRKVAHIVGEARFTDTHMLTVTQDDGAKRTIRFRNCIIAVGSSPVTLPFLPHDPRIVDSTGALELPFIPERMLVIGGGIIGLEMATVYSALGTRVDVVEQADSLLVGADADCVAIWKKHNAYRFDRVMLSTRIDAAEAHDDHLLARFGAEQEPGRYDLILQAVGRRPNGDAIGLDAIGITTDHGFIPVDAQMRTTCPNIYAIGDVVGQPMLAHKAVHQGHVAAENAAGHKAAFDALVVPSVAYTDPEIAWVGMTEDAAKAQGLAIEVGKFPWSASGRAIANGADYGLTKLIFSVESKRIIGGMIIGPNAGDLIGEVCLAIEMGADAIDIGRTIHPHPTLGETLGLAAEAAEGVCTDIPLTLQKGARKGR